MTVPTVSLIVPCRDEKDYIEPCIRALLAQDVPVGSFEIIVAVVSDVAESGLTYSNGLRKQRNLI